MTKHLTCNTFSCPNYHELNNGLYAGISGAKRDLGILKLVDILKSLLRVDGVKYYIPTDRQWVHACRSQKNTRHCGSNFKKLVTSIRYHNGRVTTSKVGSSTPNLYGLYDMTGNAPDLYIMTSNHSSSIYLSSTLGQDLSQSGNIFRMSWRKGSSTGAIRLLYQPQSLNEVISNFKVLQTKPYGMNPLDSKYEDPTGKRWFSDRVFNSITKCSNQVQSLITTIKSIADKVNEGPSSAKAIVKSEIKSISSTYLKSLACLEDANLLLEKDIEVKQLSQNELDDLFKDHNRCVNQIKSYNRKLQSYKRTCKYSCKHSHRVGSIVHDERIRNQLDANNYPGRRGADEIRVLKTAPCKIQVNYINFPKQGNIDYIVRNLERRTTWVNRPGPMKCRGQEPQKPKCDQIVKIYEQLTYLSGIYSDASHLKNKD